MLVQYFKILQQIMQQICKENQQVDYNGYGFRDVANDLSSEFST